MNASLAVVGVAVGAGVLVGAFARPLSWRLLVGVLVLGLVFLVLEAGLALWRGVSPADLAHLFTLSPMPKLHDYLGAIAIAYAAFVAATIIAVRIGFARRKASHEA